MRLTQRRVLALLGGAGLVAGIAVAVPSLAGAAPAAAPRTAVYVVQLADAPAASYAGGVAGYAPTNPAAGAKLDARSADAVRYRDFLTSRHDAVIGAVGNVGKLYDYTTAFNGFAARMSSQTAARLARMPGVVGVSRNEVVTSQTVSTPHFLGLDAPGGLWDRVGGQANAGGAGLVIGDIDTGIWPEDPAFAPLTAPGPLPRFHGTCQAGEQWDASDCNNKIVGARFYDAGLGGDDAVHQSPRALEVASARDIDGHGSHTASTAAGDAGVPVTIDGHVLGNASGMAPAARIAVYKALWHLAAGGGTGTTADLVQAINDAVSDGVDVINYSISGLTDRAADPVDLAFLGAADAGVFVAAAAGNDGPQTVQHDSPWLSTVAAGTHDRFFQATVTLGNGATFNGAGVGAAVPSSPAILSSAAGLPGADPTSVRQCLDRANDPDHPEGFLDPAKVAGRIVVCDRGNNSRVDKSRAVKEAGGIGMVLVNVSPNSLNADFHAVPTVHLSDTDGAAVKAYVGGTASPTIALGEGKASAGVRAPQVAGFSSTGPSAADNGDLLKPDIMAPGVDVFGAVSPVTDPGRSYDLMSGTSMATPHIAGIALLLKQLHPLWTPMMIKSALMTSASRTDNQGQPITTDSNGPATAFDYGSGQVTPNGAIDPGLVYNSTRLDWVRFLCGAGEFAAGSPTCRLGSIDPSDLNTPNIAVGDLPGTQTVSRTVTSVGTKTSTYTVAVQAPAGIAVTVSPTTLTLAPGASRRYTVTLTRTSAPVGTYALGGLDWADGVHTVHSQIAVRPVLVRAAAEFAGTGTKGSAILTVTPGFTGTLTATAVGLVPSTPNRATLSGPSGEGFPTADPQPGEHTAKFTVDVPAGTALVDFATFDADVPAGTDLDLFVYRAGSTDLVATGSTVGSQEHVTLPDPEPGSYDVYVDLFALAPGVTGQPVTMYSASLGSGAAGNLTVTPAIAPATAGITRGVRAGWAGLTAGTRYVGQIGYRNGTDTAEGTLIRIAP